MFSNCDLCWPSIHFSLDHCNSFTIALSLPYLVPSYYRQNILETQIKSCHTSAKYPSMISHLTCYKIPTLWDEWDDHIYCANKDTFESDRRPYRELNMDKCLKQDCSWETGMRVHPSYKAPDDKATPHPLFSFFSKLTPVCLPLDPKPNEPLHSSLPPTF